jgi:hypothetical protein
MKKIGLLILALFLVGFVSALTVTQSSDYSAVIPELTQAARVPLTITNVEAGNYMIYTLTDVKIVPSTPIALNSGTNNIELLIYPLDTLKAWGPSAYTFNFNLRKVGGETFDAKMTIRVVSVEDALAIYSDSNNPDSGEVNFYIQNKERIELTNVHARISSVFFDFEENFDIPANGQKNFTVNVGKEKLQRLEAGSYLVKAEIDTDRGTRTIEGRISLAEKSDIQTIDETTGFFIRTHQIQKTNSGNVPTQVNIVVEKNILTRLLTSFNVQPDVANRDGFAVKYSWSRKLMPGDSIDVKARTSYVVPLLILVALALIIIAFKRYMEAKLVISKFVTPVRTNSGNLALKVHLNIKSKQHVENVSLVDKIPGVVEVYEKFGTIKPTKIDTKNRRIQWEIGNLAAGEERSFSYIVYSKLGVVGKFVLPSAVAVFEKDDEIHEAESNQVFWLAEQRAVDDK